MVKCSRCGARRDRDDMALTWDKDGRRYHCHPADNDGTTCYELDGKDELLAAMATGAPWWLAKEAVASVRLNRDETHVVE